MIKNILSLGVLVLLVTSCYNDNKEELYQNTSNNCDTSNVTFSGTIVPILENNCYRCHSGSSPAAGRDYTNYADVREVAQTGELVKRINGIGSLMPQGGPKLPDCNIDQITIWVNDGAPNN